VSLRSISKRYHRPFEVRELLILAALSHEPNIAKDEETS
jgi:hypothetical protein